MNAAIQKLVSEFETNLMTVVRAETRDAVLAALGGDAVPKRAPTAAQAFHALVKKMRKKGPIQLCPAPGCKERGAPVFSMLCKKHKDTPKTTVAKWREARRKKNGN